MFISKIIVFKNEYSLDLRMDLSDCEEGFSVKCEISKEEVKTEILKKGFSLLVDFREKEKTKAVERIATFLCGEIKEKIEEGNIKDKQILVGPYKVQLCGF